MKEKTALTVMVDYSDRCNWISYAQKKNLSMTDLIEESVDLYMRRHPIDRNATYEVPGDDNLDEEADSCPCYTLYKEIDDRMIAHIDSNKCAKVDFSVLGDFYGAINSFLKGHGYSELYCMIQSGEVEEL